MSDAAFLLQLARISDWIAKALAGQVCIYIYDGTGSWITSLSVENHVETDGPAAHAPVLSLPFADCVGPS